MKLNQKIRKRKSYKAHTQGKKELNVQIEKKFYKLVKNKKRKRSKTEKKLFQEPLISNNECENKRVSSVVESVERGEISSSSYE